MSDLEERLSLVEKQLNKLNEQSVNSLSKGKKEKTKTKREPTKYNLFIRKFIENQKETLGSEFNHKIAFGEGAKAWNLSKDVSSPQKPVESE